MKPKDNETAIESADDELRLLTSDEVAGILRVSALTVRRRVDNGDLRCVMIGNRRRYRRCDVADFTKRFAKRSTRRARRV